MYFLIIFILCSFPNFCQTPSYQQLPSNFSKKTFPKLKNLPPNEPLGRQTDTESMSQACRKRPLAFAFSSSHWVKNSCSRCPASKPETWTVFLLGVGRLSHRPCGPPPSYGPCTDCRFLCQIFWFQIVGKQPCKMNLKTKFDLWVLHFPSSR